MTNTDDESKKPRLEQNPSKIPIAYPINTIEEIAAMPDEHLEEFIQHIPTLIKAIRESHKKIREIEEEGYDTQVDHVWIPSYTTEEGGEDLIPEELNEIIEEAKEKRELQVLMEIIDEDYKLN